MGLGPSCTGGYRIPTGSKVLTRVVIQYYVYYYIVSIMPRGFCFIFSERAAWRGGFAARLFLSFFSLLSRLRGEQRDWTPIKVVFFGLATNTLNVRNNNNSKHYTADFHYSTTTNCLILTILLS